MRAEEEEDWMLVRKVTKVELVTNWGENPGLSVIHRIPDLI